MIAYHGTQRQFEAFERGDPVFWDTTNRLGFFFTQDRSLAEIYATHDFHNNAGTPTVYEVELALQRPYRSTTLQLGDIESEWTAQQASQWRQDLIAQGFDGIVFEGQGGPEWVVFNPEQITVVARHSVCQEPGQEARRAPKP